MDSGRLFPLTKETIKETNYILNKQTRKQRNH